MMDRMAEEGTKLLKDVHGKETGTSGSGTWTTKLRGLLALFTTAFLVTISRVSVQALNNVIPDFQLNAMRCATALVSNLWLS